MNITLKNIEEANYEQISNLVDILNNDKLLRNSIESGKEKISVEEFIQKNIKWSKENKANLYIILLDGLGIGMISISHIESDTAHVGYWLGNEYWNKGYGSFAFGQIIKIARSLGINNLYGKIPKSNLASQSIWKKFGAEFGCKNNKVLALIKLSRIY